ncbi:MAG TPA: pyridoxal-phosphate dependent enzyme [Candidatus Eremiobacteraceae bacterium]|nr:pyridoxal-phosphate dependent enzyme [Candidatus Eremiobacteraceae bacterium]
MTKSTLALTIDDVRAAALRLRGIAEQTPVVRSSGLDALAGNSLFIKCENRQRAGAFKFRGAYNRLAQLSEDERRRGVVAFSSGNHAQGVALAAKLLGVKAVIVMPADAPATKLEATRAYGATVVTYDRRSENREEIAAGIASRANATLVPPFDDYRIMAGQGTAAYELFEEIHDLDALLVPLGGGGLLAGSAVAAKHERPHVLVYGVEPEAGNDWQISFERGERQTIADPETIADGLRSSSPGELTWPIVRALADGVLTVSDDEIRATMHAARQHAELVLEPSGSVALAAAIFRKVGLRGKRIGIMISGGNVDPDNFERLVRNAGRISA